MKTSAVILASALLLGAGASLAQGNTTATTPTDPQIAHIVVTANQIDIDAGKVAESKASSKDVKAFAKQMVTDHTGVNKQASELVKKLKVTPEDNPTSRNLKAGGDDMQKQLKGMKETDFDKAYIDNEVTFHQTVLDSIDKTLLPNAKNDELKNLITKTRPAIAAHLEHAKQLQASLNK
ncbi:DUF4142 domain-containing protein [Dechloromonas sp. XY25]|uniref:DUF4142 domain-containing protein n=1 Tax=Dechloromonas hankyongensis TaxID=2908002 RepID=A0ABS9K2I2_9RHOO|nr:DUF4142 domain-containing protein [Dechloromonas hankyongensis]MCG2577250.1 DUF4142 domain-containing protein [Dechloromonas hankyongensis]